MEHYGTDGIRMADMTALMRLGYQMGLAQRGKGKVAVAEDNRPTSDKIAGAVMAGLWDAGVDIVYGGVLPTPALQYATRMLTADAGIMVTASHNPAAYNGLKYFDADGQKPTEEGARQLMDAMRDLPYTEREYLPQVQDVMAKVYRQKFRSLGNIPLKVAVDCANGAAYPMVKRILSEHGVEGVYLHHGEGKQINRDCGALHPQSLARTEGVDMGFALDGDGDRCVVVTRGGRVVDGDGILYLLARYRQQKGMDVGGVIVSTVMANDALKQALAPMDIRLVRTQVGDSHVAQSMRQNGALLGGEPSGHILVDGHPADGIYTGLLVAQIALEMDLDDLLRDYHPLPQYSTRIKASPEALRRATAASEKWQDYLSGTGRIVVRPSGTEPVVRIMVECLSAHLAENIALSIAQAAKGR